MTMDEYAARFADELAKLRSENDELRASALTETEALRVAQRIWKQFAEDLADDPGKAKTRLISSIQIALRAPPPDRRQMIYVPLDSTP